MNIKNSLTQTVGIFIGLAIAGIVVVVIGQFVPTGYIQTTLAAIGSAVFCSGLTFFLISYRDAIEK